MGLNKQKGNMYGFVTHTWNAIKGKCEFDCSYCYMKRWGNLKPPRLDESEFKTDLGSGNFIFVGSSIDIGHDKIPIEWIMAIMCHIRNYPDNKYLFQSKNPQVFHYYRSLFRMYSDINIVFATTIETNRLMGAISKTPDPILRARAMQKLHLEGFETMVTVEPVLDFDLKDFVDMLLFTKATQINIGAVTGGHNLPEPSKEKLAEFIMAIKPHLKSNINRLI